MVPRVFIRVSRALLGGFNEFLGLPDGLPSLCKNKDLSPNKVEKDRDLN